MIADQSPGVLAVQPLLFDKLQTFEYALPPIMLPDEISPVATQGLPEFCILQEPTYSFGKGCRLVGD